MFYRHLFWDFHILEGGVGGGVINLHKTAQSDPVVLTGLLIYQPFDINDKLHIGVAVCCLCVCCVYLVNCTQPRNPALSSYLVMLCHSH